MFLENNVLLIKLIIYLFHKIFFAQQNFHEKISELYIS